MSDDDDGMDLGDMMEIYSAMQSGELSPEEQQELLDNIDQEQLQQFIARAITNVVKPHLDDIRQTAVQRKGSGESRHDVRAQMRQLDEQQATDAFNEGVADLVDCAAALHDDPIEAGRMLKQRVRNPWVMERLLLILDRAHQDDPEHADEMKELATDSTRWVAMWLIPEAYTEVEQRELFNKLYPDRDPDDFFEGQPSGGGLG